MIEYLYIHIPFCKRKCSYCDFNSITYNSVLANRYVSALCRELIKRAPLIKSLRTIYIGGGTPTVLNKDLLKEIFKVISDNFHLSKKIEITVEANPDSLSYEKCEELLSIDVNRVSLGIQSFSDEELKILGRSHNAQKAKDSLHLIKTSGFKNISVDLIYGIPKGRFTISAKKEALALWRQMILDIASFQPEHFSTYELIPKRHTPLYRKVKTKRLILPDEDFVCDQYYTAKEILEKLGYIHYEISNFAKKGFECRHNLNYWNGGDYLGIGAGAHSLVKGYRYSNLRDIRKYIAALEDGRDTKTGVIKLSPKDRLEEFLFLGLRKLEGINILKIEEGIFNRVLHDINELISLGLLELKKNHLKLTNKGLLLSNEIIVRLLKNI